jgi:2-methylcitrate dehydratase PrpD
MVKSYAAQGGLHGTIQAVLGLRAAHRIDPAAVERMEIRVGDAIYRHGWWKPERPLSPTGAQMNLGYAAAVALLDGMVTPAQFTPARLGADDVWALLGRVDVCLDEEIEHGPSGERFTADVTIELRDGSRLRSRIVVPHGGPGDPVTNEELIAKYRHLAGPLLPAARLDAIQDAVLALDELPELRQLADLLAGPVASAFNRKPALERKDASS